MIERRPYSASDLVDRENRFLLIVDSDSQNLSYTSTLLRRLDYQTVKAMSARQALQMSTVAVPCLIITSRYLKDMNSVELQEQIRRNPVTAGVPVLTIRELGDQIGETLNPECGAGECLRHPVLPEQLYRAVQAATEKTPRKNIRLRTHLPVKVSDMLLDDPGGAYTLELSERGMFLRTPKPAVVNTRLSLQVDLNGTTITAEAIVLYRNCADLEMDREPGMGLAFIHIEPRDQELIRRFIRNEVMRDVSFGIA